MDVTANKKSYIIHRSMGYGNLWLLGAELLGIKCMGAPRETSELKKVYDITSGSLLGENSSIDLTVKKYFSVVTQMPSVALCLWISLFMILYALVEGKWRYLLFFFTIKFSFRTYIYHVYICCINRIYFYIRYRYKYSTRIISLFSHVCNSFSLTFSICRFLLNFIVLYFFCIYFFHLCILLSRCFLWVQKIKIIQFYI